jgi:hypothetical protein
LGHCSINRKELAAIAKAVWSNVQHAHHERALAVGQSASSQFPITNHERKVNGAPKRGKPQARPRDIVITD